MSDKTFYVTTPIYYVNARPHIGHAYTTIVADVLARRHRLLGEDTFFLTGTDEHGQKIERSAAAANIPPQQFADQVSKSFQDLWHRMGITNNDYIRTTSEKHKRGVQKLFSELYTRNQIYLSSYTGQYSIGEEMFVEGPPGTIGPDGRPTETVTEENFFFRLSDYQLPLLNLIESNELLITPESRRNEVLSFLRGNISPVYDAANAVHESEVDADSYITATAGRTAYGNLYMPGALRDLSVSRSSFTWGIPVPEPAASASKQKHVIYVWLDALANYMTALGYGSDDPKDIAEFNHYWPADVHLVGKEIIRFHCVYWPAFLLAAGLPLPKQVTAHGWLLFEDSKMSKSKGNIVRTETILEGFGTLCPPTFTGIPPTNTGISSGLQPTESDPTQKGALAPGFSEPTKADRDLFASDILRYHLLREIPFGQDGSFSFDAMITRYNADLANGYGNLVSRTLNMIKQYFTDNESIEVWAGIPVASNFDVVSFSGQTSRASDFRVSISDLEREFTIDFDRYLQEVMWLISRTDSYLSDTAPWKIAKQDDEQSRRNLLGVLYIAAESIRIITALLYPILPYATAKVWAQLGLGDIEAAARNGELTNLEWGGLKPGTKLGPLSPIFPRADKGLARIMTDMENPTPVDTTPADPAAVTHTPTTDPAAAPRTSTLDEPASTLPVGGSTALTTGPDPTHPAPTLSATETPAAPAAEASAITIDDFAKIELRVAEIKLAERIPKADKLLRLEVDLGPLGQRQILSGIAEHYAPEDLIGRRIIVITNLAPRKMRGLESHGMLLAASEENGKPFLATVPEGVPVGTRLK